jgi:carboxymethylenebutenolidase
VVVPNPFYRSKKAPVMEGPIDFSNREAMAPLFAYRNAITDEGIDKDAAALVAFLDAQPQTNKKKKVGTQGYCMSGSFCFRAAALLPDRVGAVGSFHGGGLTTATPASPHLLIPKAKAAFLVAIAQNDDAQQPTSKTILQDAFKAAGKTATVEVYPANHGWCVPGSAAYNEAAAEKAWSELKKMYATAL